MTPQERMDAAMKRMDAAYAHMMKRSDKMMDRAVQRLAIGQNHIDTVLLKHHARITKQYASFQKIINHMFQRRGETPDRLLVLKCIDESLPKNFALVEHDILRLNEKHLAYDIIWRGPKWCRLFHFNPAQLFIEDEQIIIRLWTWLAETHYDYQIKLLDPRFFEKIDIILSKLNFPVFNSIAHRRLKAVFPAV